MCGFFGCYHKKDLNFSLEKFKKINDFLSHRGPDHTGISEHSLNNYSLKLGHKRLSILGLNEHGNQPLISRSGRYHIIYNGEIYNHYLLRKKILDNKIHIPWKGTCDTETLIELFENFQIKEILNMIEGMFAFAIYDKKENKIIISRDRSGEKPLYISISNNFFAFSSDLSTLSSIPSFNTNISSKSLGLYLRHNYIPSPYTIYKSSFKIPAGNYLIIDLNQFKTSQYNNFQELINAKGVNYSSYWDLKNSSINKQIFQNLTEDELINKVESSIETSVKNQLISDVPLGAFLSGGIDSSLIVSMMQKIQKKTKTFTIGFEFEKYDESFFAEKISNELGTDHTSHTCTKKNALDIIPQLNKAFSEPFADVSQIPTMLVSKVASKHVKVALSGDGGDELFCGYNRYILANKYWKYINKIPKVILKNFAKLLLNYPQSTVIRFFEYFLSGKFSGETDKRIEKILIKISQIEDKYSFYNSLTSEWNENSNIMSNIPSNNVNYQSLFNKSSNLFLEEAMMYADFLTYLPDDILCKVDRSSMYYSLETRTPYLNKNLIDIAFSLPLNFKIKNGNSKWILRKILSKYISPELINRPKQGFGVPISEWMRFDLKDWVNDLLSREICEKHNFFDYNIIEKTKNEHFKGLFNHELKLWSLIQFNQWYLSNHNK